MAINRFGMSGSACRDEGAFFRNPIELGWEKAVCFEHDFVGREALEKLVAEGNHRVTKTLIWNADDVAEVYKAQFQPGEQFGVDIAMPDDISFTAACCFHADRVLKDGKQVGIASGRMVSVNYHCMLSLGLLDQDVAEEGTEVTVLWGNPGGRQQEIRATVARYPYLDVTRNDVVDVSTIPTFGK